MDAFKYAAIVRKYPRIKDIMRELRLGGVVDCRGLEVFSVSEAFLGRTPFRELAQGAKVAIDRREDIYIVTEDGYFPVLKRTEDIDHSAHGGTYYTMGERVIDTIERLKLEPEYFVMVRSGFIIVEHYSQPGHSIYVYTGNMTMVNRILRKLRSKAKKAFS